MKHIKLFEDRNNNADGSLITPDIRVYQSRRYINTLLFKDFADNEN
jgi:hypothetical protein